MKITKCVSGKLQGGLGNQLFIMFTTLSYSFDNNVKALFKLIERKRKSYFDTELYKNIEKVDKVRGYNYNEKGHGYNDIPVKDLIILSGYFQSYKYFDHNKNKILEKLDFINLRKKILEKHNLQFDTTLHFRMGDYKNIDCHPVCDIEYYINALEKLDQSKKVMVFFEEEDRKEVERRVNIFKEKFSDKVFELIDTSIVDYEQMFLMSSSKFNIIANSSFSWFGAYLNPEVERVIYPKKWFVGHLSNLKVSDMFMESWEIM